MGLSSKLYSLLFKIQKYFHKLISFIIYGYVVCLSPILKQTKNPKLNWFYFVLKDNSGMIKISVFNNTEHFYSKINYHNVIKYFFKNAVK